MTATQTDNPTSPAATPTPVGAADQQLATTAGAAAAAPPTITEYDAQGRVL